jgi:hypothetical protein
MNGPSHYTMAEALIEEAQDILLARDTDGRAAPLIAIGQVHATLALAAATALGTSAAAEARAWTGAAGTWRPGDD